MRLRAVGIGLFLAVVCGGLKLRSVASRAATPPGHGTIGTASMTSASVVNECAAPRADWVWCDDFEENRLRRYFEYDSAGGSFVRAAGVGRDGSFGMRARFAKGQTEAGALHLAMGKEPSRSFKTVDAGTAIYRDLYWRAYLRTQPGWVGGAGYKFTRAMSFATRSWAQEMVAHLWGGDPPDSNYLQLDPVSATDSFGVLAATQYNDFAHFRWLGRKRGVTPLFDASHVGRWYCIEAHARLNDSGGSNGVFEYWLDGNLEARETGLTWVGPLGAYGINAVFFENYWNGGSPAAQERYFDNIVVGTQRIGC